MRRQFMLVELGTYCGYSSILLGKSLKELGCPFHIFSVEVVEQNAHVACQLIDCAGLQDQISVLIFDPQNESLESLLSSSMTSPATCSSKQDACIDFLFIDHDKDLYLEDLQKLEGCGLIKRNTYVAADNVVFAKIDDYRRHMLALASGGVVETWLQESFLEYSEPDCAGDESQRSLLRDGMGMFFYMQTLYYGILCSYKQFSFHRARTFHILA